MLRRLPSAASSIAFLLLAAACGGGDVGASGAGGAGGATSGPGAGPGSGPIWASPVIADFTGDAKLEVAVASRDKVYLLDAAGNMMPGFPVTWEDEMRSLAAGDVDGDGQLDLVAAPGHSGPTDVMNAWHADGSPVAGFPPNAAGVSGCDIGGKCYLAGCYDQNVAL